MGTAMAMLRLSNPKMQQLSSIEVEAVADTGAVLTCIPEHVAVQLRLETREEREVRIADGSVRTCRYVGPLQIDFANRSCFTGALVIGPEVLLGATAMEDMDLVVVPRSRNVMVKPSQSEYGGERDPLRQCPQHQDVSAAPDRVPSP
jgi:clan AA aspartic protease